ncbi:MULTISPECIES: hypothetical protein [Flavobacterium]|uniref:Uncharacterized protein n=1 Tax=Flavobacterium jumunjinense TaxID=998845 RepID=A0ABV5GQJ1_9FLAO|nr:MULTISPECIES: hypothetical protein [Flavobacterium]
MNSKLRIGTIVLTIRAIVSMNPWFWIITISPVILGINIIWTSKVSLLKKTLHTLIPILIGIICFLLFYHTYMKYKA